MKEADSDSLESYFVKIIEAGSNPAAGLATVAATGLYEDLEGKPVIPQTPADLGAQPAEAGKGLSSNDYTLAEKQKLAALTQYNDNAVQYRLATIEGDVDILQAGKVDKVAGKGLSDANYTVAEKAKLASLDGAMFRGVYATLSALQAGATNPVAGNYADVDSLGQDVVRYIYDATDAKWVVGSVGGGSLTAAQVKNLYESNPDTNAFTDAAETKLIGVQAGATANSTDAALVNRANHTGTQAISTVAGLQAALDAGGTMPVRTIAQLGSTWLAKDHFPGQAFVSDSSVMDYVKSFNAPYAWKKADGTVVSTDPDTAAIFTMTQQPSANKIYQRATTTGGAANKGAGVVPVAINVTQAGSVRARVRSSDGTTIHETTTASSVATGAQTLNVPVSARLGWFYVDLSGDGGATWTNGTTLIGMGRLVAVGGQSQAARTLGLLSPATVTIATLGLTVPDNSAVFATFVDSQRTVDTPVWAKAASGGTYDSVFLPVFLEREIAVNGVNCGVIGHAIGDTMVSQWTPGGTNHSKFMSTLAAAGGGFEALHWHIGGTDSAAGTTAADFKSRTTAILDAFKAGNTIVANYPEILTATANRRAGSNNTAASVQALRKAYKELAATRTKGFYFEPHDIELGDNVHQNSNGNLYYARALHRAMNAQRAALTAVGPVIASASRATNSLDIVLAVTLPTGATALALLGAPKSRFAVYPTGTVPVESGAGALTISNVAVSASPARITLTLAADPGNAAALDVYAFIYPDPVANGAADMVRDDYVADGITYGRQLEATTSGAVAVAAPGGATVVPTTVAVTPSTVTLAGGATQQFAATVGPTGAAQTVTWTSSNTAVATINATTGLATMVASPTDGATTTISATTPNGVVGTATITATASTTPGVGEVIQINVYNSVVDQGVPQSAGAGWNDLDQSLYPPATPKALTNSTGGATSARASITNNTNRSTLQDTTAYTTAVPKNVADSYIYMDKANLLSNGASTLGKVDITGLVDGATYTVQVFAFRTTATSRLENITVAGVTKSPNVGTGGTYGQWTAEYTGVAPVSGLISVQATQNGSENYAYIGAVKLIRTA